MLKAPRYRFRFNSTICFPFKSDSACTSHLKWTSITHSLLCLCRIQDSVWCWMKCSFFVICIIHCNIWQLRRSTQKHGCKKWREACRAANLFLQFHIHYSHVSMDLGEHVDSGDSVDMAPNLSALMSAGPLNQQFVCSDSTGIKEYSEYNRITNMQISP